jgi:mono/diheme cytochrome c family protein
MGNECRSSLRLMLAAAGMGIAVAGCGGGGGTGNEQDSGVEKTTLTVAADDEDGDALTYEWRVTAGSIENRNANQTVWTLPPGSGLHFAYVMVSDGKGGYTEQQYAVNSDALDTPVPTRPAVAYPLDANGVTYAEGSAIRLRFTAQDALQFPKGSGNANQRAVYLPDRPVELQDGTGRVVFSGSTDLSGEVNLPKLPAAIYSMRCASTNGAPLRKCGSATVSADGASVDEHLLAADAASNLRLYGHVALADGGVCGTHNDFFGVQNAATVQVLQADGQALTPPQRINRFGDYYIDAAVADNATLTLRIQCGSDVHATPVSPEAGSWFKSSPQEATYLSGNHRPVITKIVANGPDGNVRGRMVLAEAGALSTTLPGAFRFLSYKGTDNAASACAYYRSIGAVSGCDAQGGMQSPISFDDWKKKHHFAPYTAGNSETSAYYVNRRDLNLVRRMVGTQLSGQQIAFYVCNGPGPEGRTQTEIDNLIQEGLNGERQVACVAMEWSVTPGVNGDQPFTKFLTFGPDGSLIPSVNLDGRGEKYMPGACVACHGGSKIGGRFPEQGTPSPLLGARFLPFDTGNYLFSTRTGLTEASQGAALHNLNELVVKTEGTGDTATKRLVAGWYAAGATSLDKTYVPSGWQASTDKATFYREVIGTSCRTCHTALGSRFDWDAQPLRFNGSDSIVKQHVCGGMASLATNASMPNALASTDRLFDTGAAGIDAQMHRMETYLGCSAPADDPVYPRR